MISKHAGVNNLYSIVFSSKLRQNLNCFTINLNNARTLFPELQPWLVKHLTSKKIFQIFQIHNFLVCSPLLQEWATVMKFYDGYA